VLHHPHAIAQQRTARERARRINRDHANFVSREAGAILRHQSIGER
jgi:hypothetical protein